MMHIRSILHLASISVFADPCFVGELSLTRPYWSGHCWPALPQTCSGISWWNFHQRGTCAAWCRLPVAFVKFEKYNREIFTREQPVLLLRRSYLLVALASWEMHRWSLGNAIVKLIPERGVLARKKRDSLMELARLFWQITCKTHQCNIHRRMVWIGLYRMVNRR